MAAAGDEPRIGPPESVRRSFWPLSRRNLVFGAAAALLFLTGGLAHYVDMRLTPPFYLAGSAMMMARVLVEAGGLGPRWPIRLSGSRPIPARRVALALGVFVGAFWLGLRLEDASCRPGPLPADSAAGAGQEGGAEPCAEPGPRRS